MKKRERNSLISSGSSILALAIFGAGVAYAQEPAPDDVQYASGIEEIIVTARKARRKRAGRAGECVGPG